MRVISQEMAAGIFPGNGPGRMASMLRMHCKI